MDRLIRLIFLVLVLLPGHAFSIGEVAKQPTTTYRCTGHNGKVGVSTSISAACEAVLQPVTYYGSSTEYYYRSQKFSIKNCRQTANSTGCEVWSEAYYPNCPPCNTPSGNAPGLTGFYHATVETKTSCPTNSTELASAPGMCECNQGFKAKGAACEQYSCPPSGSYSAVTQPDQKVANAGDRLCEGGCGYQPSSWKVGQDGQIWATWPYKSTGSFCGGTKTTNGAGTGEENNKNPAPVPCGLNQCPGTVNGATVCVPCKGQQEQGPSESASAPAGAASGTQTGTKETSTTCNGINCTTTTVTKDSAGNVTGTAEKSEKQESFCKQNPESSLCKKSSFGGSCGAVTCEGDAIQCAIAADQYKRNCEWFDDPAAAQLATVGNAAITGQARPDGHPANSADSQSVSFQTVIDQTDRLGGGCPVDVSVSIAGKSLAIPFSAMCDELQLVGNLMVGFCMLVAALIVFRG